MKNIAVVGYGGQGAWHCAQIAQSDVCVLAGTYDIREVRRQAAEKNGVKVYDSNEAIFADPEVDAVVIAVPNDAHKALVIKALESGKNVICEKPVEMSCAALDEMIAAAERTGKFFTVHQNRRWDEDFLTVKNIMAEGKLGEIFRIESRVHGSRGIPGDWRQEKEHGGGMVLDWGVHLLDQALLLYPGVKLNTVYATLTNVPTSWLTTAFLQTSGLKTECMCWLRLARATLYLCLAGMY